jgi:serine protease inhibitor
MSAEIRHNYLNLNATAVIGTRITAVGQETPLPLVFRVDHPFLALIVDDFNKVPLFVSRVTDPAAS